MEKKSTQIDDRVSRVVESFFLMQFSYYSGARWFAVLCSRWAKRAQSKPTRTLEPLCAISSTRGWRNVFTGSRKKFDCASMYIYIYVHVHTDLRCLSRVTFHARVYIYTYIRIWYTFIYKDRYTYVLCTYTYMCTYRETQSWDNFSHMGCMRAHTLAYARARKRTHARAMPCVHCSQ